MKIKYLLMTALVLPCTMLTACGGDDDDSTPKTDVEHTTETKKTQSRSDSPVDNNFKPDASYLQTSWFGEYEGWDAEQQKNTTIQRTLTLLPNGNYTNIIAGKLLESDKTRFYKFESEAGTYTYNSSTQTVTYTCRYDSVLNYKDQTYRVYDKKHISKNSEQATYTEKTTFTEMREGMRDWITKDTYLKSLTDDINIDLEFEMKDMSKKK